MYYTAGQVAKFLGLNTSTIRYYDKEKLIPHVKRSEGGIRLFTKENITSIRLVQCMKKTGLSLDQIRKFMSLPDDGKDTIEKKLQILSEQKKKIETQFEELKAMDGITDLKIWYYKEAQKKGGIKAVKNITRKDIPKTFQPYYDILHEEVHK